MTADRLPDSKYGVICAEHGKQGLSEDDYHYQMMKPDSFWFCPLCRGYADWDDDRYEQGFDDAIEDGEPERFEEEQKNTGKHLPKVYQLPLDPSEIALVGIAMQALRAAVMPNPIYRLAVTTSVQVAHDAVGHDEFMKDVEEILNKILLLSEAAAKEPCPHCGEIHAKES